MKIIVHRGAAQIGGCITEIATDRSKIIIDLGSNLPGINTPEFKNNDIKHLTSGVDAIFYTHYHGDHVGFLAEVNEDVPQYIGIGAKEVLLCKYSVLNVHSDYSKIISAINKMHIYKAGVPITKGDFTITPYYCSHSAFDSYMFKIEVEGKVILHTGDYRSHGYIGNKLIPMLKKYVGQVDILITEGTMLGRSKEIVKSEKEIQYDVTEILKKNKYVFALSSSTDIDRLASFHAACIKANRFFYIDKFQELLLDIFTKYTTSELYNFSDKGIDKSIFVLWKNSQSKIASIVMEMKHKGFLMPIRSSEKSLVTSMKNIYNDEEPILIYSMWSGYYNGNKEQQIDNVLKIRSLFKEDNIIDIHTSGHADVGTICEVCKTTNPRIAIIPIHKDANTDFRNLNLPNNLIAKIVTNDVSLCDIEIVVR